MRTLQRQFFALPEAFMPLMATALRDYLEATHAARAQPDSQLLAPILEQLQRMQTEQQDGHEAPGQRIMALPHHKWR